MNISLLTFQLLVSFLKIFQVPTNDKSEFRKKEKEKRIKNDGQQYL